MDNKDIFIQVAKDILCARIVKYGITSGNEWECKWAFDMAEQFMRELDKRIWNWEEINKMTGEIHD